MMKRELKVCPNLDYIGLNIEVEKFIKKAQSTDYNSQHLQSEIERVKVLYTVRSGSPNYKNENQEVHILQVDLKDKDTAPQEINTLVKAIQREIPYRLIIIFVYRALKSEEDFYFQYRIAVPKFHKGVKKDISVVDDIAITLLIYHSQLKSLFSELEKRIVNKSLSIEELFEYFHALIKNCNYGWREYIADNSAESEIWELLSSEWREFANSDEFESEEFQQDDLLYFNLAEYQEVYGYDLIEDFFEFVTYKLDSIKDRELIKQIDRIRISLGHEDKEEYNPYEFYEDGDESDLA